MLRSLKITSWGLVAVGGISAQCEADWRISLVLIVAGFAGIITHGLAQGSLNNDRYRAAVLANSPAGTAEHVAALSPYAGLLFLVGFLSVAFLSVYLNSPLPAGVAFAGYVAVGINWTRKSTARRNAVWQRFASNHDLTFDEGNLWNGRDNTKITGRNNGRDMRLEIYWEESGSWDRGRKRSEALLAKVTTAVADVTFCIDDLKIPDSAPDLAKQLFEFQDLTERIGAAAPRRISLFEGSLTFHCPRVPSTEVELTFYTRLLSDAASTLE